MAPPTLLRAVSWFVRGALSAAFLSAVADRFGVWGAPGQPGVAWGAWQPFVDYTAVLLFYLPKGLIAIAAVTATVAEIVIPLWLLIGLRLWLAASFSAALLLAFGVSMVIALGPKAPLDYSVFTAAAASCLLAATHHPRQPSTAAHRNAGNS